MIEEVRRERQISPDNLSRSHRGFYDFFRLVGAEDMGGFAMMGFPGCAVCEKQPSSFCRNEHCGWRGFCRDRDDRREIARIMGLSEADLAAEVTRNGETPESVAAKCRAIFERACAIVDGRRTSPMSPADRGGGA